MGNLRGEHLSRESAEIARPSRSYPFGETRSLEARPARSATRSLEAAFVRPLIASKYRLSLQLFKSIGLCGFEKFVFTDFRLPIWESARIPRSVGSVSAKMSISQSLANQPLDWLNWWMGLILHCVHERQKETFRLNAGLQVSGIPTRIPTWIPFFTQDYFWLTWISHEVPDLNCLLKGLPWHFLFEDFEDFEKHLKR